MKNICHQMTRKAWLALFLVLTAAFPALAQKITVTGTVYEPEGEPAIGASVTVKGTTAFGVSTDFDGNYTIQVAPDAVLVFSYVGCDTQEIPVGNRTKIDVKLKTNSVAMSELVVIGYGVVKKSDATGAVGVVKPDEVQAGLASTAQDLLVGASPGVVVSTKGGNPNDAASIQIRGGASLNASNDPLIVIDGVPMTRFTVTGSGNPLALVNPENIETMTILKDASATAIYGSRASNGVIIITTKTGKAGRPQVNFAANFYVAHARNYLDMMDGNEFRNFINGYYGADSPQAAALGTANTDWQKEALRTAFSQDYSLSVGGTAGFLPYNVSVNYTGTEGIVKTTHNRRLGASINLTPKFFDDLLSVNVNLKGAYIKVRNEQGVLGAASAFNPTLPVHMKNNFGNWTTYVGGGVTADENTPTSAISTLYAVNPISRQECYNDEATIYQSVGNIQLDLKMPFLRELRANLNLGYDLSHGSHSTIQEAGSPQAYLDGFSYYDANRSQIILKNGYTNLNQYHQRRYSLLLSFYLNYNKSFEAIKSDLDVTAGYEWQRFNNSGRNWSIVDPTMASVDGTLAIPALLTAADGTTFMTDRVADLAGFQYSPTHRYASRHQLISFFARLNYTFMDRYLLTATVRRDGTSRFGKDNRWGTFPSFSLGWRISEEAFMENARSFLNDLKLRASYGTTGQQDLGEDYFPYLPVYVQSTGDNPTYPIGGEYVNTVWPSPYNSALKWETTHTWNVGLDYGFLNNRINGSIEFYVRKTSDLLTRANYPAGSNIGNVGWINLGDLRNTGIEVNISTRPVVTNDFTWTSNVNFAWNKNKITRLAEGADTATGYIEGVAMQKHVVNNAIFSYYVLEQAYDKDGNVLEGVYVDQNADGVINGDDYISYHHVHPDITATWNNSFNYKNWDLSFSLRGNFGNWAYNANLLSASYISRTATAPLSNLMANTQLFKEARDTNAMTSSYFVQNASFVRCDNITLGYTWNNLLREKLRVRLFAAVQNPFVITKYKGLDPELTGFQGIDNSVYPRPVTYTLGLVATF